MGKISIERLQNDVHTLLGPHTRLVSSSPILRVEQLIHDTLLSFGWAVERQPFSSHNVEGALDYGELFPKRPRPLLGGTNTGHSSN